MSIGQAHRQRLVLIDGHAILHRAYHAFPTTLRTRKGELVNAVYGFTRMILKVIEDLAPEYIAVAFDLPEPTFRHKEFIGYQVQRPAMDEELKTQIERVKEVVCALSIPIFAIPGYEADDVIGSLSKQAVKRDIKTVIVTGDKDFMQLVNKKTKVYSPVRGFTEAKLFGEKEVEELLGVKPSQIIDYKALVGDSSDNYPGVTGIGPKTAVQLLGRFGNFKRIYKEIKKIENKKLREKLTFGKESAELSKKLATIVTNAPVKLNLKACRVKDYGRQKAIGLFEELEFRSLINKLPGVETEEKREEQQMKLLY